MTLEEEILNILNEAKYEIVNNIISSGETASGRTQNAIKVISRDGHFLLLKEDGNNAPIGTLEIGRKSGKVPYKFTDIITEWMKDKGISTGDEKEDKKKAGAIAYTIANSGTKRFSNNRNDIYSNVVNSVKESLSKKINDIVVTSIQTN